MKVSTIMDKKFSDAIDAYAKYIVDDYMNYSRGYTGTKQFEISFDRGSKFIKIVRTTLGNARSVHSFVALEGNQRWPVGTILKSASWRAPAQNFARGNIFTPEKFRGHISWTGAH